MAFVAAQRPMVFDPDGRLGGGAKSQMMDIIRQFDFIFHIVVVSRVDLSTSSMGRSVSFDEYSELFIQAAYPGNSVDSVVSALYSLDDRKYRIRAGENLVKRFPSSTLVKIAADIVPQLRSLNYDLAFVRLAENIRDKQKFERLQVVQIIFIVLASIFAVIFALCCCHSCKKSAEEAKLRKIFMTYKQIKDSGVSWKLFAQENCVICLEKLPRPGPDIPFHQAQPQPGIPV